jgi:hypothetical protein
MRKQIEKLGGGADMPQEAAYFSSQMNQLSSYKREAGIHQLKIRNICS